MDSLIEKAQYIEMNRKQTPSPKLLITIFSLGYAGLLNETEKTTDESQWVTQK